MHAQAKIYSADQWRVDQIYDCVVSASQGNCRDPQERLKRILNWNGIGDSMAALKKKGASAEVIKDLCAHEYLRILRNFEVLKTPYLAYIAGLLGLGRFQSHLSSLKLIF